MTLPAYPDPSWFGARGLHVPADILPFPPARFFPLNSDSGTEAPDWLRVIDELHIRERAIVSADGISVRPEDLWQLEPIEQDLLGLPRVETNFLFRLISHAHAGSRDFRIELETYHPRSVKQPLPAHLRSGPFISLPSGKVRVARALLPVVKLIDGNATHASIAEQLQFLAEVKRAAVRAGVQLDQYLEREEAHTPEGLGLDVHFVAPDEVHLSPVLEGIEEDFDGVSGGRTCPIYTKADGTRRTRLLLTEPQRAAIDELKAHSVIRGTDVPRFQQNPEAFLPEAFDLTRYSPRVRGVVPYRYRSQPYLSISPSAERDWFEVESGAEFESDPDLFSPDGKLRTSPAQASIERDGMPQDIYRDLCEKVVQSGEEHVLHGAEWIHIDREEAAQYLDVLSKIQDGPDETQLVDAEGKAYMLDVASNVEILEFSAVLGAEDGEGVQEELPEPEVPAFPPPQLFKGTLRSFQLTGYRWLRMLYERSEGGLLADDMGLGKTVQVIAFLAHLVEKGELSPTLIVVPKTLLTNWQTELTTFCPSIRRIYVHQGPQRIRHASALERFEVVLVTYETLRRDEILMGSIDWAAVICDEAQNAKNPSARVTSVVKAMKGRLRLAMTGTPVENGLSELWCIVDFVEPGRLGSRKEFRRLLERPLTDSADDSAGEQALKVLHERLGPHYLRRTKAVLATELPDKSIHSYEVSLGRRQERLYKWQRNRVVEGEDLAIAGLQRLIQVCSHPELLQATGAQTDLLVQECPKLQKTVVILEEIERKAEKALLFTRYRTMQHILQRVIDWRFRYYASILNGSVGGGMRQPLVDQFESRPGFGVLILAPEAAGVGLNIVGANHVIHYSRLWNPAKEAQATDRVYRIRQTRPVSVHYPLVTGGGWKTVEEHLDVLLRQKSELATNVLVPSQGLDVGAELQRILKGERDPLSA